MFRLGKMAKERASGDVGISFGLKDGTEPMVIDIRRSNHPQ